jgi:plastocyanin
MTLRRCVPAIYGLALVALVLLSACSGTASASVTTASNLPTPVPPAALATIPPPKPAAPTDGGGPNVGVENFNFVPADLTVPAGTTVVWTNHDDVEHTVTSSDGSYTSQSIPTDGQFSHTFAAAGTFTYFCAIHPFMTAKVTVQ